MSPQEPAESAAAAEDATYLAHLGERVRELRAQRGLTRKALAVESGVSERYLAQLETGRGNISILLLRQLARALDAAIETLVSDTFEPSPALLQMIDLLRRMEPSELERASRLIGSASTGHGIGRRADRIALIGLRGAGKSTLGRLLAQKLDAPFVELNQVIEAEAGVSVAEIFNLYGQQGYRRLERRSLGRLIASHPRAVIATGGGIVADPETFALLKASCYTIWLQTSPSEHMQRVVAQGDMRPMANNREAMADLRRILRAREALYASADAQIDTSREPVETSLGALEAAVRSAT